MRLLIVTQYFWPEHFRINDLVTELVQRGHQVTVLTGVPNYPDGEVFVDYRANPARYASYDGALVQRVPMLPRGKGGLSLMLNYATFAISASLYGPWKLRGQRFDAVIAYEPSPITVGLPAVLMRRLKKAPLIFWVQDLWPETLEAVGAVKSKAVLGAVGRLVAFIYKRCDLILAQSKAFIPHIEKYAPTNRLIQYFPNWAEVAAEGGQTVAAPEVPLQSESFNVMFAGNIGDAQDFPAVLAAAERLRTKRNIRWLIVGDGRMARWVSDEVTRRNLRDQVLLLGRFPGERMPSFFKHADALLVSLKDQPIFSLTIPSKLQTYLAAGIPVIAMLNGEGANIVRESGAGLACDSGDDEALAEAVLQMSQLTPQERLDMGRRGLLYSQSEFDRDSLITRLEKLVENLCAGSPEPTK